VPRDRIVDIRSATKGFAVISRDMWPKFVCIYRTDERLWPSTVTSPGFTLLGGTALNSIRPDLADFQ